MEGRENAIDGSWNVLTEDEKRKLKNQSFTVNPNDWDLTFMGQNNGRNVPDWNRQNPCMRFNHLDKLMLTKNMFSEMQASNNKNNSNKLSLTCTPHEVANYAFCKLKK